MKKTFKSLIMFAAAALTLAGCSKDEIAETTPENSVEKITISAVASLPQTRVSITGADKSYKAQWDATDAIDIVEFADGKDPQVAAAEDLSVEGGKASFTFQMEPKEAESYTYYAVYPGGKSRSDLVNTGYSEIILTIPTEQKSTTESLITPEAAVIIAKAETTSQNTVEFTAQHAAAYAKMTITGIPSGKTVKSVKFENLTKDAEDKYIVNIAGDYWYMYEKDSFAAGFGSNGNYSPSVTVDLSEADASDNAEVWFALAPVGTISSFSVVVTDTDDNTYSKTVTGASFNFTAGKIIAFSVGVEEEGYTTIAEINGEGSCKIKEAVVVGSYNSYKNGFIITDSSEAYLFVYANESNTPAVGTKLSEISGTIGSYNKGYQLTSYSYTENGTTEVSLPEPTEFDYAKVQDYITNTATTDQMPTYITYTGKLSISNNYYNVILDGGSDYQCSLYFDKTKFADLSKHDGKNITVKGFITAVSSGKYINTCVTSIEPGEEVEEPEQPDPADAIYFNNFDKSVVTSNTNLTASTNVYKNETGTGASNVTYSFAGTNSIRTSNASSDAGFSGNNNIFFGSNSGHEFTIENINLSSNKLQLTFAGYSIKTSDFFVKLSNNGTDWSGAIDYTLGTATSSWMLATADFTLPEGTETLYIKFITDIASTYRIDDVKLVEGDGGQDITFDGDTPGTDIPTDPSAKTFTIKSSDVVSNSTYDAYTKTVDNRDWVITFGGNNLSIGTNSNNRTKCTLSSYSKYAVSPVKNSSTASAFASTTKIANVSKIAYTFNGGSSQNSTKVYLLYSTDNETFSQMDLTSGVQGAVISTGTEFEFEKCSGYFAVLFEATNTSGNWRIDNVDLTFTYSE